MEIKDREIAALFRIVNGITEDISLQGIDLNHLIRLSYRHKVVYQMQLFAHKHPGFFTADEIGKLNEHNVKVARLSLTQLQEIKRIDAIIGGEGIRYICIKGPQLSRMIYGREALKDSVDLDLMLVNGDDLPAVHALLSESGYTRSNLNEYPGKIRRKLFLIAKREISYYNPHNRIAIDLHIRPGANTYLTAQRFDDFFQRLKPYDLEGTTVTVLSDEAYFVYLCYHGALHQFSRLAWLADIRAFLKLKGKSMLVDEITTITAKWRVTNCVDLALRLIKEYFGEVHIPVKHQSSFRLNYLASSCRNMLNRKSGYGTTIPGRISKTIYIMFLLEGMAARVDWFYGMVMRKVVPVLAKKSSLA